MFGFQGTFNHMVKYDMATLDVVKYRMYI